MLSSIGTSAYKMGYNTTQRANANGQNSGMAGITSAKTEETPIPTTMPNTKTDDSGSTTSTSSNYIITEEEKVQKTTSKITGKLMAGKPLTQDELSFLEKNNPDLYEDATSIATLRQGFTQRLMDCNSKDQVRAANLSFALSNLGNFLDAKANREGKNQGASSKQFGLMAQNAISYEYKNFIKSPRYASLPEKSSATSLNDLIRKRRKFFRLDTYI